MELMSLPIKVPVPTGNTLYRGDETFTLAEGRELLIRDSKGAAAIERFRSDVPAGKSWSVRILLEITETTA